MEDGEDVEGSFVVGVERCDVGIGKIIGDEVEGEVEIGEGEVGEEEL